MAYDYTNHYKKYLDAMNIQEFEDPDGHPIMSHYKTEVNRLFRGETLQEIRESLKTSGTVFGRRCLDIMNSRSPTALAVTL